MEKKIRTVGVSMVVACVVATAACGSSSGSSNPTQPSSSSLTQTQIASLEAAFTNVENSQLSQQVFSQLFSEINTAYGAGSTATSFPINVSQACADAGTAGMTGTVSVSPGATFSLNANLSITFSKCTSSGVELDGTLSSVGQVNGVNTNLASVIVNPVTFTISGTSTFLLNNVTGSSAFNCSNSVNVNSQTGAVSGVTASGNATLQFPTGQNSTSVPCSAFSSGFTGFTIPATH
jgi:hypothetical protein